MPRTSAFRFEDHHVIIRRDGAADVLSHELPGMTRRTGDIVAWDPETDGIIGGIGTMDQSSDHGGERHLDGDELLFVTTGRLRLVLELEDGQREETVIGAGEAVFVPRGLWHHLEVDEPGTLMFMGGGRTEIRVGGLVGD